MPDIESMKICVKYFKMLLDNDIPIYAIPGNHDFSVSGKTFLEVLEESGIIKIVYKYKMEQNKKNLEFTVDPKTKAHITGFFGQKDNLQEQEYGIINRYALEEQSGFKIFLFHSPIEHVKPVSNANSHRKVSFLPRGFDYYAGGHAHYFQKLDFYGSKLCYPGALFPANFDELIKQNKANSANGQFIIYDDGKVIQRPIEIKKIFKREFDVTNKNQNQILNELFEVFEGANDEGGIDDDLVLLKFTGKMSKDNILEYNKIVEMLAKYKPYYYLINRFSILRETSEDENYLIHDGSMSQAQLEQELIKLHLSKHKTLFKNEENIARELMKVLETEKNEDETKITYQERIVESGSNLINGEVSD